MASFPEPPRPRPAVFLDRDGTLIREEHYLSDADRVALLPGVGPALESLAHAGLALVLLTNQSGIARGLFSMDDYEAVNRRLSEFLARQGVELDGAYVCPHHPDFGGLCECRKPATGLHRRAALKLGLDLEASYHVGDRVRDVLPAMELGGQGILVRTGYGAGEERKGGVPSEIRIVDDLTAAARWILGR